MSKELLERSLKTCICYSGGQLERAIKAELAKPQTKPQTQRLSEERVKELVASRFDYGSAALSELVKAVEQEVLSINGLGE